jgi:hypothetical protein
MEITAPPSTPALDAARAECTDIATNPQNPRHAGYWRGEKQVMDYLDGRYRPAVPENKPVEVRNESVSATTDFSEDTQAHADVEIALRQEFGDSYYTVMQDMTNGAQYLFNSDEGRSALTVLSDRIAGLGPKAEALGIKFLADLSKLQQGGR